MKSLRLMCCIALAAVSACAYPGQATRSNAMDTTGWSTYCFGRFLVDLPPSVRVTASYEIWGEED